MRRPPALPAPPAWWPDAALGALVVLVGFLEAARRIDDVDGLGTYLLALGLGVAVGVSRRLPGLALFLVWLLGVAQLREGIDVMIVELSVVVVAFSTARWGQPSTVVAAGLSIPAAAIVAVTYVVTQGYEVLLDLGLLSYYRLVDRFGMSLATLAVAAVSPLVLAWLLGLLLRALARSRTDREAQERAEEKRAEAEEVARLKQQQADLARDVHDVVGHSLAVILAQAESAQYRADTDTEALRRTLRTIATSARSSLGDVRQVLSTTGEAVPTPAGGLDQLVDGVRSGGHEVVTLDGGTPRPLPPELDQVAYRVLQEMLTNALRHGRRDRPVEVERWWGEDHLRIAVSNAVLPGSAVSPGGSGVDGMRRRLESVGGRLRCRLEEDTFTATAWVPSRAGGLRS